MYVVGLMYESGAVAAAVQRTLCAVPDVDVHVLPPPCGHRQAGHLDVLVTDCAQAGLLPDPQTGLASAPPADVMLVVPEPFPGGTTTTADARRSAQHSFSTPSAIIRAAVLSAQPHSVEATEEQVLSERERQVLLYIAEGLTHAQTARRHGISPHTVDTYVKRVRGKLGIGNKAELARAALMYA